MLDVLPQLIANGVIAASLYALVAVGFNLIFSTTKFFNLAHGSVMLFGVYAAYQFFVLWSWPLWISIVLGIISAGLIGYLSDLAVFRYLRKKGSSYLIMFVASLGVFTIFQALFAIVYSSQFKVLIPGTSSDHVYTILGGTVTLVQLIMFGSAIAITVLLMFMLRYTRFGTSVRAVADDEDVSKVIGIPTDRIIAIVFVIGSAIAGLAGILQGIDTGVEPTIGLALLLKGVIAAVVGGLGNIPGALLGSLILGLVENFGIWFIPAEWKDAIAFGLLIIFMIFRPYGILNRKQGR